MNITIKDYPLIHFMNWLTGGNHEMSVDVPREIGIAVMEADPKELLAHVEANPPEYRYVIYWKDYWTEKQLIGLTQFDLLNKLTEALQKGDLELAKIIQSKIKVS